MLKQSTCQVCHNKIPAGRRLCDTHRKHRKPAPSRAACVPMWSRILSVRDAGTFSATAPALVTTADILALRDKSTISCSGVEFEVAADLAQRWNEWMAVAQ